ncbi:hypothetical protein CYY_007932 [Polysphondylium violaceum]|uniref:Protein kinase domain-containing protein n=1 Tax=Polysphondylium violaceum TaxID=133409 RepID=A0A8J4PWE2_9MYCE|nr:hypothetical protein CYY_007932 [Polysphondylium violaceum]
MAQGEPRIGGSAFDFIFENRIDQDQDYNGSVWRAVSIIDGNAYAIKVLDFTRDRFEYLTALKTFDHPNIVKIHDVWHQFHRIYVQMELCLRSLNHVVSYNFVNRILSSPQQIFKIMSDVSAGLQVLHNCGIYNVDLCNKHLLIAPDGTVKICGFGVSSTHHTPSPIIFDFKTVTPEIMNNSPIFPLVYNPATDVYDLGLALYELYTCQQFLSCDKTWYRLRHDKIDFAYPQAFKPLALLLKRMLTSKPEARISIAEIMQSEYYEKGEPNPVLLSVIPNLPALNVMIYTRHSLAHALPHTRHYTPEPSIIPDPLPRPNNNNNNNNDNNNNRRSARRTINFN